MRAKSRQAGILFAVAILFGLAGSGAAPRAVPAAEASPPARTLYLKYCSACHGENGRGEGVVSQFMRPKPTDLTQLARKAGGRFPFVPVMESIDGTKAVRAHGDSDMPVWGESFRDELPDGPLAREIRRRGSLALITEFVASIQAE